VPSGSAPVLLEGWSRAAGSGLQCPADVSFPSHRSALLGNGLSPGFGQAASVWRIATPRGVIPLAIRSISEKPCNHKSLSYRSGKGDIPEAPVSAGASCCLLVVDFRQAGASPRDDGQGFPSAGGDSRDGHHRAMGSGSGRVSPRGSPPLDPTTTPLAEPLGGGRGLEREGSLINSDPCSCAQAPCC
jgi:hypothetical protein